MTNLVSFSPFPELSTNFAKLRKPSLDDVEVLAVLRANKQNAKYLQRSTVVDLEATKQWLEKIIRFAAESVSILWVIEDQQTNEVLGTICLWNFSEDKFTAEVGYELFPNFQGKGYMSEALKAIIAYAKQIQLNCIEAFTHKENLPSLQLLKSHNFVWQQQRKDDDVETNVIYTLHLKSNI